MLDIDSAQWQRLSPLLDEALALPAASRAAWLQALPAAQADLRPLLAELLADGADVDWTLPPLAPDPAAEPAQAWQAGDQVAAYRLLRPIGHGGMGTVWLAQRPDLPRPVALKLPHGLNPGPALAERMAHERDLLAALEHPHIARLYDAGVSAAGQPYLALEFVSGSRIDEHCRAQALALPARLRLFLQAAQAVAHAHSKLIVHRDLKPSNLLVGSDGQVKLLDFGIAKLLDHGGSPGDTPLTRAGALPMTPEYAAPEQIAGLPIDTRADIYALGVLLFELLTGQRPYRMLRPTAAALEQAVLHDHPLRPSEAVRDRAAARLLRGDLDTIVAKALKKDPAERYATVQALADDIERHLEHRPVLARPDSLGYVLRRLVRRHRLRFAAAGVALVGVLAGAGLAGWQAHQAELERQRASAVSDFFTRLLRDASPYRGAAVDWRTQRLLARLLRIAQPGDGDVQQVAAVELLRQAGRQLEGATLVEPETRSQLMRVVAEGLAAFGDLPRAERLVQGAVDESRRHLGDRHLQTLRAQLAQVLIRRYRGDAEQVNLDLAQLLPLLRAQSRHDPEGLVVGLQLRAVQSLDQGQLADGLAAIDEAAALLPRLGDSHPERVSVTLLRARALRLAGRLQASFDAAASATALASAQFGAAPHPIRVEARIAQARARADQGDAEDGLRHYEAALDDARRLVGADSPLVAFLLQSTVPLHLDLGADEQADQRSSDALQLAGRHLPPGTFGHDAAALTRAQVLLAQGRAAAALALVEPAVQTFRRILGDRHRQTAAAQLCLAQSLLAMGRLADARDALAAAASGMVAVRPPVDDGELAPLSLRLAAAQAQLLRRSGDASAAIGLLQPLLAGKPADGRWRRDRLAVRAEYDAALTASASTR